SLLVTSGPPDSSLQVWQVSAEDSDAIKSVSAIAAESNAGQPWAKIATISARAPWVLHGSSLDSVQITEVESRKNVYTAAANVSLCVFFDMCQRCKGNCRRSCGKRLQCSAPSAAACCPPGGGFSSFCPKFVPHGSAVDGVSAKNRVCRAMLCVLAQTRESLAWVRCRFPRPSSGAEFLRVSWAPALQGCLAVSGFDGTVHVYDAQSWDSSGREAEPIFIHKGHALGGTDSSASPPLVTTHTWHPQKPRTLLSAASDGSLHVWEWVRP
ncbi:WDR73 protein, partial [Columbina picui]|nr:WDR73 protein [Columbina picui]